MSSKRDRGTTLAELLIATAIFTIVMVAMFMIYRLGLKLYTETDIKTRLESDLRRAFRDISYELKRTSPQAYNLLTRENDKVKIEVEDKVRSARRDILVIGSRASWYDTASIYSPSGSILWNRIIVYYSTNELYEPYGKLYKYIIDTSNEFLSADVTSTHPEFFNPPPNINASLALPGFIISNVRYKFLAKNLVEFLVERPMGTNEFRVTVDLRGGVKQARLGKRILEDQLYKREFKVRVTIKIIPLNKG